MWEDPIVEELHRIREKNAAKYNYDVRALVKHYQVRQRERGHNVVSPPPRRISAQSSSSDRQ